MASPQGRDAPHALGADGVAGGRRPSARRRGRHQGGASAVLERLGLLERRGLQIALVEGELAVFDRDLEARGESLRFDPALIEDLVRWG